MDDGVIGILIAHLGAFVSGELKNLDIEIVQISIFWLFFVT